MWPLTQSSPLLCTPLSQGSPQRRGQEGCRSGPPPTPPGTESSVRSWARESRLSPEGTAVPGLGPQDQLQIQRVCRRG